MPPVGRLGLTPRPDSRLRVHERAGFLLGQLHSEGEALQDPDSEVGNVSSATPLLGRGEVGLQNPQLVCVAVASGLIHFSKAEVTSVPPSELARPQRLGPATPYCLVTSLMI